MEWIDSVIDLVSD